MLTATRDHFTTESAAFDSQAGDLAVVAPGVLIVEDDPDVQTGWSIVLGHQGYDVTATDDGAQGLALIEEQEPDVVVLDLGLPGMHGQKVLHEIRMRGLATKVVVVTASFCPEVEMRSCRNGAHAVLAKPASPAVLVDVIERLLRG
ncbi:MAG: response regulator [Planctomycetes bacterium]|nr:response regulator [Planctomycetota bacterium]